MEQLADGVGAVDYWCNAFTPDRRDLWERSIAAQGIRVKLRTAGDDSFCEPDEMLDRMDELGVATLVVPVCDGHVGQPSLDFSVVAAGVPVEVRALAREHPGRFFSTWSVDPLAGMRGVEDAEVALEDPTTIGLHVHTHSFDRAFDHADLYPYYALAARHEVPVVMQAGTSGGLMPSECGRPIGVDRAAIYFPKVAFVLSHLGWPWVDEAIAMALKFPNVYLGTAVYPARHWPEGVRTFLTGPGRHKVLYGSGFPVTGHRHTLGQLDELDLDQDLREAYLAATARRIFGRLASEEPT